LCRVIYSLNKILFRYFSFKMAWEKPLPADGVYLMIAPPHGILPFGNLLTGEYILFLC
jgi:hypothetical protein